MAVIFHLDLDCFFVSVERVLNPKLNGKPVIVGGRPGGRGVVTACSYEARKFGLHSAMPINRAFKLCPHGIYIGGTHGAYSKFSNRVKEILERYAPEIEQASIDEFYMDFTGCGHLYGNMNDFASKLQNEIFNETGLPSSIGIAGNKTSAKIASDCNKPQGITYILPGMEKEFLSKMPVEVIPGVGKNTLKFLQNKGIYTIEDAASIPKEYMESFFGKYGADLWRKANGQGREYINEPHVRKSISKERTYFEDVTDIEKVESTIFRLTGMICQSLRNKGFRSSTVSIKIRYSDFSTFTRAKSIQPTNDDNTIYATAVNLFRKYYNRKQSIRLIGVHLSHLTDGQEQEDLFNINMDKRRDMFRAVSGIRNKYGYESIDIGKFQ